MKSLYLDTNIFIYLSDKHSPFYNNCLKLINYSEDKGIFLSTSTETIQEIIHYSKNTKQLPQGLELSKNVLLLIDTLYPINKTTIDIYLKQAEIYPSLESRDLIHLSVCTENKVDLIASYDKKFKTFKGVSVKLPEEIISLN